MATIGNDIKEARQRLIEGLPIGMPTETVYGLAANALSEPAVLEVFKVKERPSFDPLIVHIDQFSCAEKYAEAIPKTAYTLARAFCPGPLTFILPKKEIIPDLVTSGHPTVGIRVPQHPMAQELLKSLDFPLAAPSANKFGNVSPTSALNVEEQIGNEIEYILDGGDCEVGLESTIVTFEEEEVIVLRLGGISLEQLEETLQKPVKEVRTSSSKPQAPGMLTAHYSPGIPVHFGSWASRPDGTPLSKTGFLCLEKPTGFPSEAAIYELSPRADLNEAARQLFRGLRSFNPEKVELIVAEPMPELGLGRAINDRLRRAAATNR